MNAPSELKECSLTGLKETNDQGLALSYPRVPSILDRKHYQSSNGIKCCTKVLQNQYIDITNPC